MIVPGVATSVAVAPIAAADPTAVPEAGCESASAAIKDLPAEGFNGSIGWVSGLPHVPLSACKVTATDTGAAKVDATVRGSISRPIADADEEHPAR